MENTFYFSHDYGTRSDEKIKRLIRKWKAEGYGIFWYIIEDLYNNANALQTDYEGIAYDYRVTPDLVKSVINDFDLFIVTDNIFASSSVGKRLEKRNEKSAKARESAMKRWKGKNANALQTQSDSNAIKERKGKENKGKESKHKYGEYSHVLLLDIEKEKLIKDIGKETFFSYLKKLDEYIEVKGVKYKNHYLVIRKWINSDNGNKKSFEKKGNTNPLEGL